MNPESKIENILTFFDDQDPCKYYFIKSGFPNSTLVVSEDPIFGSSLRTVDGTPEENLKIWQDCYRKNYNEKLDTPAST